MSLGFGLAEPGNKAELNGLGLEHGSNMSLEDFHWENSVIDTTCTQRYGEKQPIFGSICDKMANI